MKYYKLHFVTAMLLERFLLLPKPIRRVKKC